MPIDDLLWEDANQQSVTYQTLDVFGEWNGISQKKTSKAIPQGGIDRLPMSDGCFQHLGLVVVNCFIHYVT
jgi:hypothetical protein